MVEILHDFIYRQNTNIYIYIYAYIFIYIYISTKTSIVHIGSCWISIINCSIVMGSICLGLKGFLCSYSEAQIWHGLLGGSWDLVSTSGLIFVEGRLIIANLRRNLRRWYRGGSWVGTWRLVGLCKYWPQLHV